MENKVIRYALLIIILVISFSSITSCKRTPKDAEAIEDTESYPHQSAEYDEIDELIDSINTDSSTPAKASSISSYEYSWTDSDKIPPILIIVDDFGYAKGDLLDGFADLPEEVVFAVLPDLPNTEIAGQKAAQTGHEVIIHIPMQAKTSNVSPGKRYVKEGSSADEIAEMIDAFYAQLPMAIGANNHMGSTTTADKALMNHVLKSLAKHDLSFVDSFTSPQSVGFSLAKSMGYKSSKRDIFLDVPDNSEATIISKIEGLGKFKGRREPIVIISHCHNKEKLRALQSFITQIKAMGLELITLRDALKNYSL